MGKRLPEERWREHILERFTAFKASGFPRKLQATGLAILRRKKLLTGQEWQQSFHDRISSQKYLEWYVDCKQVGERFGLAPWTVQMACLLKDYKPEESPFVMEVYWPRVRVVTENANPIFLQWLSYEAQRLGLYVVQRQGSVETALLYLEPGPPIQLLTSQKPPHDAAFYIRLEVPVGYPPEAREELNKQADQLARELLRRLGYPIHQRLRSSKLVSMADKLRVADEKLEDGDIYGIMDEIYGKEEDLSDEDLSKDRQRRSTTKTQRHRVQKRLIKPYELEP